MTQPKQDRKHCWYCGCEFQKPTEPGYWPDMRTRDHVIPRSKIERGQPVITVPCCLRCNIAKGNLSLEEFRLSTPFPLMDDLFYGEKFHIKMRKRAADRRGFNSLMADKLMRALSDS